mgnify:CR=1 FL=1
MRRTAITVALVALIALAGCSAFSGGGTPTATTEGTATDTATETVTPDETTNETATPGETTATETATTEAQQPAQVQVTNGSLSVDATTAFDRVQNVTASDVRPPTVVLRNLTERKTFAPGASPQLAALGFENASLSPRQPGGLTVTSGRIYLHQGEGSAAEVEQVLAHEYVHTVQFRSGMLPWLTALDQPRRTSDLIFAQSMLAEGSAVYATDEYTQRHLDIENQSTEIERRVQQGNASERLFWAKYLHGYEYTASQVDSSANLSAVFEDYPTSTEAVLHHDGAVDTSPVPLAVDALAPSREYVALATDTNGEYILRSALDTAVDYERATAAATGWGNDTIATFRHTTEADRYGWVWTIRMDNETETDELVGTLSTYAEERSNDSELAFESTRLDSETAALTIGTDAFVENTTVSATDGNVTVEAGA